MRTIEDIQADMSAVIDGAAGRSLTDDECDRYENLEAELQGAQRSAQVRARNAAYNAPAGPAVHVRTGKPEDSIEKAFEAYLRTGKPNADIAGLRVSNAQSEGTPSEGGYLVPDGFRTKLVERMKAFGGIANVAEEFTTSAGNPVEWPTVDDTSNTGEIVAEGNTFASGADITFGTNNLGAFKYMAGGGGNTPLRVSVELLQDAAFDVQGLVSRLLGTRIARLQATHLATGTGSGQPLGLVYGLTGVELAADTAGVTYNDLVTFIHSVDPAYRASARWVFNDNTLATLQKLVDSHGDPIWRDRNAGLSAGLGESTLLGYPVTIDQAMPDIDADNNTVNWGAFGDIREGYVVRRVRDVQLVVNPYTRAAYGQVEFTAWARMDATQQNTNAYVALTGEQ